MKTEISIYLDYRQAMADAERLGDIASNLRNDISKLQNILGTIDSAWTGPEAGEYRLKLARTLNRLEKMERAYCKAADAVRQIAENTYRAEMTVLRLASSRTY